MGIQPVYHIVKGIIAGDPIGEFQKLSEPVLLGFSVFFNRIETLTTADNRTNRDGENVDQQMLFRAIKPGVSEVSKGIAEGGLLS